MKAVIGPKEHGVVDYVFSGVQMAGPTLLGLNKKATRAYLGMGTMFMAVNLFTATPVGYKPLISWETHKKMDLGFLGKLALLTLYKPVRKNRKALFFHLGFFALASAQYILTDY